MRKYLIAALAALTAVAFTTAAIAQSDQASSSFKVSPKKAGSKKHPRNSKVKLGVENKDTQRTLSKIDITFPKTIKLSGKGFKTCSADTLDNLGKGACPSSAKVGGGVAKALLGVNLPADQQQDLTFKVTAYVGGKKNVNFYLEAQELQALKITAPGKVHGRKLTITVPDSAQSPAPGVYAGLVSLDTTLKGKGKKHHYLIATTGCKHHKQPLKAKLTFIDNGVSDAGTVTTRTAAKCK